jgi:hypothetical protein
MIAFKDFIIEYYKGNPIVNPRMSNGKDPNSIGRIHQNITKKTYKHKAENEEMPAIDNIVNGKVQSFKLSGQPLMALLAKYDITFSPGETKVLGNSAVEVEMSEDVLGNTGVFRKRKTI